MRQLRCIFLGVMVLSLGPAVALANTPKLDEVLRSINESSRGEAQEINWTPVVLILLASVLAYVAVKHWNRRVQKPKVLNNHAKLLKEAAAATGVSARQLKQLEELAKVQGLSSPLVAILCPSAVSKLAQGVRTDSERKALMELAEHVLEP